MSSTSVDLYQARSEKSGLRNSISTGEWARARNDSCDGETIHLELVIWESGGEADSVTALCWVEEGLDDRQVLLVDVHDRKAGEVGGTASTGDCVLKLQILCLGLDVARDDCERFEDWKIDLTDVGAASRNNEVLIEGGEGEFAGAGRQEG